MTAAVAPHKDGAHPSSGRKGLDTRRLATEARALARSSVLAVSLIASIAIVRACGAGAPKPKTLEGLVEGLSSAAHVAVRPDEFVWEGTDGVLLDFERGRHILFLGAERPGAPRDVFRARVHLSPEGRPLEVTDVVNLTKSPDGDEQGLVRDATAERAAFATYGLGHLQGITALDLRSKARASQAKNALERGMLWVTNIQEDGDGDGIARVQIMLEKEATAAILAFDGPTLVMQLAEAQGGVRVARIDVDQATVIGNGDGLDVSLEQQVPKRFDHWAVDTVRLVIGPDPIAWLEDKVWTLRDRWLRFRHKTLDGRTAAQDEIKTEKEQLDIIAKAIDPSAAGEDGGFWPPQAVPTLYKTPEPGEGEWVPFERPWMHRIEGAPSPFYQTFIRPDPERPYSKIILVAMDTRQLDFDMEAGTEDPKSTVGAFHGSGRLPRDAKVAARAVAAFNGGFKSEHGHYGMMLRKHILLPPVPNAASAIVMDDGRFGMGAWGPTKDVGADLLSYRQNLDPLIDNGLINPRNRGSWGAVLPGQPKLTGQQTERSGLCLTRAKHLLYVWGDDVGADALGKGMQLAGCDFGMHLDMNPHHTGFVFMSFDDAAYKNGKSEVLTPLMAVSNRRYIDYAPKDFFYALVRDPRPDFGAAALRVDPGLQPQPTWLPAIFSSETASSGVIMTAIEPGRVRFRLRAGSDEKAPVEVPREIVGDDGKRVIAAIGLGVGDPKNKLGLIIDQKIANAPRDSFATLSVRDDGSLSIATPGEPMVEGAIDLVQGAALIVDGKVIDDAPRSATFVHLGIGMTKEGRIVIARGTLSSDEPIAKALLSMGCVRALAARGDVDGFIARAGTPNAPMTSYSQTTLYAIAEPMGPRAFRFDRDAKGKPLWPIVTTPVP